MAEGEAVDPEWWGYECKAGQILFYYNKTTGEHIWANGDQISMTRPNKKEPAWCGYECKSGEILFHYNKTTGEHRWTHGDQENSDPSVSELQTTHVKQEIKGKPFSEKENNEESSRQREEEQEKNLENSAKVTFAKSGHHACLYCKDAKLRSKITRHLKRCHKEEDMVKEALTHESTEMTLAFEKIRMLGDYHHNFSVLSQQEGQIVIVKRSNFSSSPIDYVPCVDCYGFFKKSELWRHCKECKHNNRNAKKYQRLQSQSRMLLPPHHSQSHGLLVKVVLSKMKDDDIAATAKSDKLILRFGESLLENDSPSINYISQRMRQLARLLLVLKTRISCASATLEDFMDTSRFNNIVEAVKSLCKFDSEEHFVETSNLALQLGHSIKKCGHLIKCLSLKEQNMLKLKKAERFLELFDNEWLQSVSSRSSATMGEKRHNDINILIKTEDINLLDLPDVMKDEREDDDDSSKESAPDVSAGCTDALATHHHNEEIYRPVPSKESQVKKVPWTKAEKRAIFGNLNSFISQGALPGKKRCEECITASNGALNGRSWSKVKYFVKNEITRTQKLFRKSQHQGKRVLLTNI